MKDVVIVSACRTAIGSYGGSLKPMNGATLAGIVMKEAVQRADIDPSIIDDVRFGCCLEHHDTLNVTRIAALLGFYSGISTGRYHQPRVHFRHGGCNFRCSYDSGRDG